MRPCDTRHYNKMVFLRQRRTSNTLCHFWEITATHAISYRPVLCGLWDQISDTFTGHVTRRGVSCPLVGLEEGRPKLEKRVTWYELWQVFSTSVFSLFSHCWHLVQDCVRHFLCLPWLSFLSVPCCRVRLSINRKNSNSARKKSRQVKQSLTSEMSLSGKSRRFNWRMKTFCPLMWVYRSDKEETSGQEEGGKEINKGANEREGENKVIKTDRKEIN